MARLEEFYECKVCNRSMAGITPAQSHLEGSRHIKALRNQAYSSVLRASSGLNISNDNIHSATHFDPPARYQPASTPLPAVDLQISSRDSTSEVNSETLSSAMKRGIVRQEFVFGQTQMTCTLCSITCSGEVPMNQHLLGEPHMKRQRRIDLRDDNSPPIARSLGIRQSSSVPALTHDLSTSFKQFDSLNLDECKSSPKDILTSAREEGIVKSTGEFVLNQLTCTVCRSSCTGDVPMKQHLQGSSHQKKMRARSSISPCTVQRIPPRNIESILQGTTSSPQMQISEVLGGNLQSEKEKGILIKTMEGVQCVVCSITCNGEVTMTAHLSGDQHRKKLRAHNSYKQYGVAAELRMDCTSPYSTSGSSSPSRNSISNEPIRSSAANAFQDIDRLSTSYQVTDNLRDVQIYEPSDPLDDLFE
ncbi:uncharacterized protein LOC121878355 isoform X2 [Homarus americanus]|uniref:uncharacterized protein LOC121878355 isoform X2 n=1 Tax=Homarus americanus TaxID=6706 RepID=UPI001C45882E|nr:uncharacterized protein LOC121878355 isoform X2 [Homarus americanus]